MVRLESASRFLPPRHFTSNPRAQAWLRLGGSLTAHLRRVGDVRIVVLREGPQSLWIQERRDLGIPCGYVREVTILVNGRSAVWARSATSTVAVKGPWRALASLGSRPLAELLFHDRGISRSPLQPQDVGGCSPDQVHIARALQEAPLGVTAFRPAGARSSVFMRQGQALRVYEAFAPWILELPCACALPHCSR